jgi:hypothetical protein
MILSCDNFGTDLLPDGRSDLKTSHLTAKSHGPLKQFLSVHFLNP